MLELVHCLANESPEYLSSLASKRSAFYPSIVSIVTDPVSYRSGTARLRASQVNDVRYAGVIRDNST